MSLNQKKAGVVLQYGQMSLGVLISFIYTPIMLRILGQTEYGIYNFANSIISYLSLLSLGFAASYLRFYSRYKKEKNEDNISRLNGLFLLIFITIGIVAFVAGLIMSNNVSLFFNKTYSPMDLKIARILMIFMAFNLALSFPASVFESYVTSQERFVFQKLLNMFKTVVSPFVTLPILILGYGSIGMVVITTVITVLVDAINIWYCMSKLNMRFCLQRLDFELMKEIAAFSSFIAINQIVDQINWATDKLILGKMCGSVMVAIYAIGSQINTYYLQISTAVSNVFVPQINRIAASELKEKEKNKRFTDIFISVGRGQFIILMLILTGFVFFGKRFVYLWAGEGYENSYFVALLLISSATVPLIQNIGLEIQRAKNRHQFRSIVYLVMAFLNVIISIFMAQKWGEIGAAFGTAITLLFANGVIMNIFYHKILGIDIIRFWKEIAAILPAMIAPIIYGVISLYIEYKGIGLLFLNIIIYSFIYLVSMYFLGLNKYEKCIVSNFKIRFIHRKEE